MSKHTEGTWLIEFIEVRATAPKRSSLTTVGTPMIDKVCKHEDTDGGFPLEANASLIAAAPELLDVAEFCEQLLMRYEINRIDGEEISEDALARIRAAIAREKGGQA